MKIKVACSQVTRFLDFDASFNQHADFIKKAYKEKVDILLFPELSLTGYGSQAISGDAFLKLESAYFPRLSNLAKNMLIILGFAEKDGGNLYNSVVYLYDGKVVSTYRKINLPHYGNLNEKDYFEASDALSPFIWDSDAHGKVKMHTLICADMWNPALVHTAMLDKPDLLLAPICSIQQAVSKTFSNKKEWPKVLDFYSMIYATPIMMANYWEHDSNGCWGGSAVYDAYGNTLARANNKVDLITAEVNLNEASLAREQLPTIRDANSPLIFEAIRKRL